MSEYDILKKKLENGKKVTVDNLSLEEIDNINKINIDRKKEKNIRILNFIKEVKNPYCFLVDDMKVKMEYSSNNLSLNQCLCRLISTKVKW